MSSRPRIRKSNNHETVRLVGLLLRRLKVSQSATGKTPFRNDVALECEMKMLDGMCGSDKM